MSVFESMDGLVEVYDTRTGIKLRTTPEILDGPVTGRFLKKTPSQRRLDGELGELPTKNSSVEEIRDYAEVAEVDLTGLKKKDELLDAVLARAGEEPDLPATPDPDAPAAPEGGDPNLDTPNPDDTSGQTPA